MKSKGADHLDIHKVHVFLIGSGGAQVFMSCGTASEVLNIFRAYNSGWDVQICLDATYGVCNKGLNLMQLGINSLGGKMFPFGYSIGSGNESAEYYTNCWEGAVSAALLLATFFKRCEQEQCEICDEVERCIQHPVTQEILKRPEVKQEMRLPVDYAMADNSAAIHRYIRETLGCQRTMCFAPLGREYFLVVHILMLLTRLCWQQSAMGKPTS